MFSKTGVYFQCVLIILLTILAGESQASPELIPLDHWSYQYIDQLVERDLLKGLPLNARPYSRRQIKVALENAESSANVIDTWLITLLRQEFYDASQKIGDQHGVRIALKGGMTAGSEEPVYVPGFDVEGVIRLGESNRAKFGLRVQSDGMDDPSFGGVAERDYMTEFDLGYLRREKTNYSITVGRFRQSWGAGLDHTLMMNSDSPTMDQVAFDVNYNRFSYRYFLGTFPVLRDEFNRDVKRYYSAHRMELNWNKLSIGGTEHVVWGGIYESFDWAYANPLIPFYATEQNRGTTRGNVIFSADVTLRFGNGWRLYGEGMLDDFQVDIDYEGEAPTSSAWLAGLRKTWSWGYAGLEFAWIDTWSYNNMHQWSKYQYRPGVIRPGHPYGSDALGTKIFSQLFLRPGWIVYPSMELVRQGENNLDNNWGGNVEADPSHPSGVVTKRLTGEICAKFQPNRRFWLTIGGEYSQVWNVNHVSDVDEDYWRLELKLWFLGFEKSFSQNDF